MSHLIPSPSSSLLSSPEALLPVIDRLAAMTAQRFPKHIAQRLRDDAPSHVFPRLRSFCSEKGRFEPWCSRLLHRLGLDLCKRRKTSPFYFGEMDDLGQYPSAVDELVRDEEILQTRRDLADARFLLAGVRGGADAGSTVDFFAVLQLHARLALANRMAAELDKGTLPPDDGLARMVEDYWPWDEQVAQRRCTQTWPTLGELWKVVGPCLDRPPFRVSGTQLCRLVSLVGGRGGVTAAGWAKWCQRARVMARERISPADWSRLFATWLGAPTSRAQRRHPGRNA
jgi:hypothetical protein